MKIFFTVVFAIVAVPGISQLTSTSQWTYMKGGNVLHGVKGVSHPANNPNQLQNSSSWTDQSGNLWLFGGNKHLAQQPYFNTMWKYSVLSNEWTWMHGDSLASARGIYGTKGVESSLNCPGARTGATTWVDSTGHFWLFGGIGFATTSVTGVLNDLWRYNKTTNQWAWIKGDSSINIAASSVGKGISSSTNKPGCRTTSIGWTDANNNFWLFGGNSGAFGGQNLNDLWKFNMANQNWTWVKGDTARNKLSVYGIKGVADSNNNPGSRCKLFAWKDTTGNFWLFGGEGYANSGASGNLNDLWKYDKTSNNWTWVNGDSTPNKIPSYGQMGVSSATNKPGARSDGASWVDLQGQFWMFGGSGITPTGSGFLNDLWKYDLFTKEWTWMKGDGYANPGTSNGTQGIPSSTNKPGGKSSIASWMNAGTLWLFGGRGLNELWKFSNGYTFTGNGSWNIASNWVNNLVAPTFITDYTDVIINPSGVCNQINGITTTTFGKLHIRPGKTLNLSGDVNNGGTIEGTGTLNLTSGSSQMSSTGFITTPMVLSSKSLSLNSDLSAGPISLTNNLKLTLGSFRLRMGRFNLAGDSANFVITNGTGRISSIVGATPTTFHIGTDSTSYTPATITNTGTESNLNVRVLQGVTNRTSNTTGNVNRTWKVDSAVTGARIRITLQWNQSDEQQGFQRGNAYVAQSHSCPQPPNCTDSYFDVQTRSAASGSGTGPFTMSRDTIVNPTTFIIKSSNDVSTFTGNGDWNDPNNWTIGVVPPTEIGNGREIVINHPAGGQCTFSGDLKIKKGGILKILPGKKLMVSGKVVVENTD